MQHAIEAQTNSAPTVRYFSAASPNPITTPLRLSMDEETGLLSESLRSTLLASQQDLRPMPNQHARGRSWGPPSDSQGGHATASCSGAISRSSSRSRDLGGRRNRARKAAGSARRWDPTVWGSFLLVVAGFAVALAWFLTSAAVQSPEPDSCISYVERECLLKTRADKAFQAPQCVPRGCAFSTEQLRCPFAARGAFERVPKVEGSMDCEDPFMEATHRRLMPPCSRACCDGEMAGSFLPGESELPGSQTWQPRRVSDTPYTKKHKPSCSFFQYSSVEVLQYLQSNRARVFVMGDSLQKELHSRVIHMFRGSSRIINYRLLTMARYALCQKGDAFTVVAGGYDTSMKGVTPGATLEKLPGFFGAAASVAGCSASEPPVVFDNVYSAWFTWQVKHLKAYRAAMPKGEALIVVIAVNAMEKGNEVPLEWLQYLDDIRNEVKIIVVSTPTGRLADKEMVKVLQYRNKLLKSWAASIDAISFVDMDAMSRDAHHPPHCQGDIHQMCWLKWAASFQGAETNVSLPTPRPKDNVLRDRQHDVAVASIHTTTDGECRDEMNRNLWQIIFNIFMKWEPKRESASV